MAVSKKPKSGPAARLRKRQATRSTAKKTQAKLKKAGTPRLPVAPVKRSAREKFTASPAWRSRRTVTGPILLWIVYHLLASGVRQSLSTSWWLALIPVVLGYAWSRKVDPRDVSQWAKDDIFQNKDALRKRPSQKNRKWWSSSTRVAAFGLGAIASVWACVPPLMIGIISVSLIIEIVVLLLIIEARVRRFGVRPIVEEEKHEELGPIEVWNSEIGRRASAAITEDVLKPDPETGEPKKIKLVIVPAKEAGKLPGSTLIDYTRINENSWTAIMAGVKGKQGTKELRAAIDTVSGVYGINPDWVEVQGQDDYSRPRLIVTERATLLRSKPFTFSGLTPEGTVEMGCYPDGSRSKIQVYVPGGGVRHIWFTAGSNGGKTGSVNVYLGQVMPSGMVVLDLVDLGETSLPAWVSKSFRFGTTPEQGLMALRRGVAVMKARMAAMRTMTFCDRDGVVHTGISTLPISLEWPIYTVMFEEWQVLISDPEFGSQAAPLIDTLGRLGRKYGVQVAIVSQGASLEVVFKGAKTLRTNIQTAGNVVALKADAGAGTMAMGGTISINLGRIPPGMPGLGYVVGPANYRDVLSRTDWCDDHPGRPADIPSSWEVAKAAVPGCANAVDLSAIAMVESGQAVVEEAEEILRSTESAPVKRSTAEETALRLLGDDPDAETTLAMISAKSAPECGVNPNDTEAMKRHYEMVRKQLETSKVLVKVGRGKWRSAA